MTRTDFLMLRRTELPKTWRLLEMFPDDKGDVTAVDKMRNAYGLSVVFLNEERASRAFIRGQNPVDAAKNAPHPKTVSETLAMLRAEHEELNGLVERMSDEEFSRPIQFFNRTLPLGMALTYMLLDHIHHRGQFTVFSRLAGARVPKIFGPSADEPTLA